MKSVRCMTKKADSKKAPAKKFRGVLSPGERVSAAAGSAARAKANSAKKPKIRRDKYRSFSVTDAENKSLPGRAKKAGFSDVAVWLRFVSLGVRN
jgi:hypothetical protein